jgi:starch synthase (maltosyl-transferring)
MKPSEGRKRIVIEEIQPAVDNGRYPAKRILGDQVEVTAAIFGDGHDHVAARLLYRHASQRKWSSVPFKELNNDLWTATFTAGSPEDPSKLGLWHFTIEAWIDHFETWVHDLDKRLAAQTDSAQDIPLALRIGAVHFDAAASRA